jgi:hypothetical protein
MGATAQRKWHRGPASLALLTSLVVLSSFFVIAGAQIASAQTCGDGITICHLVFSGEPHDALTGQTITTTDFNIPPGDSVRVEAQDEAGQRVTSFSEMVTLVITTSSVPKGETVMLSGNSAMAFQGVATFPDLKISHSGTFTLRADSSTAGSVDSTSFTIWDKRCEQNTPCVVSKPNSMSAEVNTSAAGTFLLSLNADSIDCGDPFNHAPGTVTVDSTSTETKVVTIRIDKSVVKATPNNGVMSYQVCYESGTPFSDRNGAVTTKGLLPDCPPMPTAADAPCILSKTKDRAGRVVIRVLLPAGDPKVH